MIGKLISHYRIVEELGRGGMGVVYKAHDSTLDRFVALKFIPPEMTSNADVRSRFVQEARAASALDHPNIAVVHEIGTLDDGASFICMAYYEGETLRKRLDAGPLDVPQVTDIAGQICNGLQRAHEAKIIHRDIKPANLILTPDGTVKIVDFGLAKLSGQLPTSSSGRLVGTTAYMSPEQIQGKQVDHRSDLFSVGIVLYEMLTGKRPFTGEHEAALLYSIIHDDPTPPSSLRNGIPLPLERITLRLLQKDPDRRFQSAADVRTALHALASGTSSVSPPIVERLAYLMRSRKALIALSMTGIILLCVALFSLSSRSAISLVSSDFVMVADVENNTEERIFEHSLTEAMTVSLRQSAHLNLLSPERIMGALERMRLPRDERLTDSTALSVARREGARVMIASSISQFGTTYVISGKVVDVASGAVLNLTRREVPQIERVLTEMDAMCRDIRELLGESLRDITASAMPLEHVTTPSLQALELHSQSMQLQRQGKYQEAAFLEEQAIREDSLFAMAVSELSYIYRKLGKDSLALYYHRRSYPLMDRVTDRERLYMLTIYNGPSFELEFPRAYESIRQLVVRYPNDAEGFSLLGWLAMYDGNTRTAIEAFQRSLALDSATYAGSLYNNWGYTLALAGDGAGAREFYAKSKSLRPGYLATDGYIAQAHWMSEALDSAERTMQSTIMATEGQEQLSRCMELASLYEFEGRIVQAQNVCRKAIMVAGKANRPAEASYFHYLLGELAAEISDWTSYSREMKDAERLSASPYLELPLIGTSYARSGKVAESSGILSMISAASSSDPYFVKRRPDYLRLMNGELLLKKGLPEKAAHEFEAIQRIYGSDPLLLLAEWGRARCADAMGDTSAAARYENLLGRRGEVVMACIRNIRTSGFWIRRLWTDTELALGKLYMRRNDPDRAGDYIRRSLKFARDADPRDRRTREAKELLSQLTKGR